MSLMKVEYFLNYKFLGLKSSGSNLPEASLIKEDKIFVFIRSVDKMPKLGFTLEAEGKLKKLLGGDNGTGQFSVTLASTLVMQGEAISIRVLINNS